MTDERLVHDEPHADPAVVERPPDDPVRDGRGSNAQAEEPGRPSVVSCRDVGKCFDDTWIIEDIDLEVGRGSIVGLIGPSGSGKTTLVRLMNGVYAADAGEIEVFGVVPTDRPTGDRVDIGYLPQDPVLFDELSLWQNLSYHSSLYGVPYRRADRLEHLLELVGLAGEGSKLVRQSSGGMKRRLGLAAALVHDPPLLLLDEPTAGVDPILRKRLWDHFRSLASEGRTLVITTQFVEEAALCDEVGVLADGRIRVVDTPDGLRRRALGETYTAEEGADWNEIFVRLVDREKAGAAES